MYEKYQHWLVTRFFFSVNSTASFFNSGFFVHLIFFLSFLTFSHWIINIFLVFNKYYLSFISQKNHWFNKTFTWMALLWEMAINLFSFRPVPQYDFNHIRFHLNTMWELKAQSNSLFCSFFSIYFFSFSNVLTQHFKRNSII